jgi:hypothetical protein
MNDTMSLQIPWLLRYSDIALLLVRLLPQLAALGLILVMLGAIRKKIFVWHTELFVAMCLVVATTGGGRYVLLS